MSPKNSSAVNLQNRFDNLIATEVNQTEIHEPHYLSLINHHKRSEITITRVKRKLEDKLNQQINEYKHLEQIFLEILKIHAPIKKKLVRANHVPYMTKTIRKAIMKS